MKNKELNSLTKMIQYIDKALSYTKNYNYDDFLKDEKTQDAVIFNISQICEMIKDISDIIIAKYDNIDWKMIKGLRNRIVHDYSGINLENIWYIINNDLEVLRDDLNKILAGLSF